MKTQSAERLAETSGGASASHSFFNHRLRGTLITAAQLHAMKVTVPQAGQLVCQDILTALLPETFMN